MTLSLRSVLTLVTVMLIFLNPRFITQYLDTVCSSTQCALRTTTTKPKNHLQLVPSQRNSNYNMLFIVKAAGLSLKNQTK